MVETADNKIHALWQQQLNTGLGQMGLDADGGQVEKTLAYLALLAKWNKAYNLTAIRNTAEMVSRQLLDSLSILPLIQGSRVLDVGTGAGLPGIPLSIMLPQVRFVLLDTNSKKTRFVKQSVLELGLDNVQVVQARVEKFQSEAPFNTITTRAFAALSDMLAGSQHLLAEGGQWLAMKGQNPEQEQAALPSGFKADVTTLFVPGESGQRHAVLIRRSTE